MPDAAAGSDGEVQYTWNRGDHYLSLDIIPDQPTEFFYRNRQTGAVWDCESDGSDETASKVPDDLAIHLKLFLISKTV